MVTNNAANNATGATSTVLTGQGVGTASTFSATPTVTSVTFGAGNALSSYVEGTWTPVLAFGGASVGITYSGQVGLYTRIGRIVVAQWNITLSNKGSSTGSATVTGLPYTSILLSFSGSIQFCQMSNITLTALYTYMGVQIASNSTIFSLFQFGSAQAVASLTDTNFGNTSSMSGVLIYQAQ